MSDAGRGTRGRSYRYRGACVILVLMTTAQRFVVLVHTALVVAFLGYTLALAVLFVQQVETGYISEGAKASGVVGLVALGSAATTAGGVLLWARTGQRRFPLVADALVITLSWSVLLVLLFFQPIVYMAVLGLTLLCVLVAAVVPGPARRS